MSTLAYRETHKAAINAYGAARYASRKAAGICQKCPLPIAYAYSDVYCEGHHWDNINYVQGGITLNIPGITIRQYSGEPKQKDNNDSRHPLG